MAAHTKTTCQNFDSAQFLLEILDETEVYNLKLQRICQDCKMLFKPWPNPKICEAGNDRTKEEGSKEQKKGEDSMSLEERSELERMNKLLNKAHKALELQNKHKEKQTKNLEAENHPQQTGPEQEQMDSRIEHDKGNNSATHCTSTQQQRTRDKSSHEKHVNTKSLPSGHLKNGMIKSTIPSSTISKSDTLSSTINRSGPKYKQKKVVSAHVKAPFQTHANISVPKRSTNQQDMILGKTAPKNRVKSAQSRQVASLTSGTTKSKVKTEIKTTSVTKDVQQRGESQSSNLNSDKVTRTVDDHMVPNSQTSTTIVENNVSLQALEKNETPKSSETLGENLQKDCSDIKLDENKEHDVKVFSLMTEGHNIPIPVKLRRLHSQNLKLRQKMYVDCLTKKVESEKCKQDFVDKMESMFCGKEESHIGRSVTNLCRIYTKMYKILADLSLDSLSENSSAASIFRARKVLELLLTSFSHLEEKKLLLHIELLNGLHCVQQGSLISFDHQQETPLYQWMPKSLRIQDCLPVLSPGSYLLYKRSTDLDRLGYVVFQIQYIYLNLQILNIIMSELLPVMMNMDPTSSEYIQVIRVLYSLLSDGESFPVVVMDTINDLDESMNTES